MLTLIDENINLKDFTLIIPSVSVGNIGQLAADLLITTLNLPRVGYIRHRNIQPVIGGFPGKQGLATECELYASNALKIAIVQIRSTYGPFVSIAPFFTELCKSCKSVVIITGSYMYESKTIHRAGEQVSYMKTNALEKEIPEGWKALEVPENFSGRVRIPGSGIADHLFHLCEEREIPAAVMIVYVSEGDNRADAAHMANNLDMWLKLRTPYNPATGWKCPPSWDCLFGNALPNNLF